MAKDDRPVIIVKKKKGRHGGGHHGGAWKVAYADFITVLFALFLVLWLLTQADLELRQSIARYFRNSGLHGGGALIGTELQPATSDSSRPMEAAITIVQNSGEELEALRGYAQTIEESIKESPGLEEIRERVKVEVTEDGLQIQVIDSGAAGHEDLLFDLSSAELKPALVELLKKLAEHLGKLPNLVEIGGHTDARPFASRSGQTNWSLSFARADAARKILIANGLRAEQIFRVAAYGDSRPLNEKDPMAAENRRLSILARLPAKAGKAAAEAVASIAPRLAGGAPLGDAIAAEIPAATPTARPRFPGANWPRGGWGGDWEERQRERAAEDGAD